ncbi:hypothetical protein M2192_000954 [Bradyrhizobium elkanii USDA 61]|nr:hypothetical protein [Bradyrhizobium elkanii]MCS4003994.1 hypothetical protein [Bradyrhizobium elkanii USDA 61]MCP1731965.1 hypothetical protein [Bradyrhizobium elkanii]MCP1932764.1 hypothetical protein [Bradyrhizobium elkanii]MCS3479223.1 hypothetical protein [Bradyrhizobium elkanii]
MRRTSLGRRICPKSGFSYLIASCQRIETPDGLAISSLCSPNACGFEPRSPLRSNIVLPVCKTFRNRTCGASYLTRMVRER